MNIAFIGGRDIHKLGGIETYMLNLCTQLVMLGHTPIVYCESDRNYTEVVNGFRVVHWKAPKSVYICKIFLGLVSTLHALFVERNVRVFHYNAWPPSLWSWVPRLFGRQTLMMGHGLEWKRTKYSVRKQRIMRFMERLTAKINSNLVMVSKEQTDWFLAEYNKVCVTIPTAINLPDSNISSSILEKYQLAAGKYFLFLGRLVQDKNPDYLISAYSKSRISDYKLVIAGANDSDNAYVEYLKSLGNDNKDIIFTGAVYGDDKEALLCNCGIFCIPSTIEGLSITLLEAMSYAKPVIASDIPANREALEENGIWVKAEDEESLIYQMNYCCNNAEIIAQDNGQQNYIRVQELFTWPKVSRMYIDYLEKIV